MPTSQPHRRWLVPEIVQTSAMDCGPAALTAMLRGFKIQAEYEWMRSAGQTDVDGTSLDALEELAQRFGLDAEQVIIPADDVITHASASFPAIAVTVLPNGLAHFMLIWRSHGPLLQCMDPAQGRRWLTQSDLRRQLYIHAMPVAAMDWLEWAHSPEFCEPLRARLHHMGCSNAFIESQLAAVEASVSWEYPACLDALARMVESLVRSGGLAQGKEAADALAHFIVRAGEDTSWIPARFWHVSPCEPAEDGTEQLLLRGALLLRIRGVAEATPAMQDGFVSAQKVPSTQPTRSILRQLLADGVLTPITLLVAALLAGIGVIAEEQLFRWVLELNSGSGSQLQVPELAALPALTLALLILNFLIARGSLWLARNLEIGLRAAYSRKIPLLGDAYFRTRPVSDMAERGHSIARLRLLVDLGRQLALLIFELILTAAAIVWLFPAGAPLALGITALMLVLLFSTQPLLWERDLRLRTHAGALGQFYLDTLLGLTALRVHRAERAVRWEHGALMEHWFAAGLQRALILISVETMLTLVGILGTVALVGMYIGSGADTAAVLLLSYWALKLPILGEAIAQLSAQYPHLRSTALRLFEPLAVPEVAPAVDDPITPTHTQPAGGIALNIADVTVVGGGRTILSEINVQIAGGEHVAIVGPSGAGKSSLVGLLLGWQQPAIGCVTVDEQELDAAQLEALRKQLAWVDPAVQIWNRSLQANLLYGVTDHDEGQLLNAVESAQLREVVARLPDGLATVLGEGGGLVSGGEGQRVRFARALLRCGVRLAILDEPFRGLDRSTRSTLLKTARSHWNDATLLCITHDVSETLHFPRVLVIEDGCIVEDGPPEDLAAQSDSRYRRMLDAEAGALLDLTTGSEWQRLRVEQGRISVTPATVNVQIAPGYAEHG